MKQQTTNTALERIYEYDNYRFLLRDYFAEQKRLKSAFSHRFFARRAGFSSSSFCAHVIEGKRNLTLQSVRKMVRGLGLSGKPSSYFENLVFYNQAKSVEDREHYFHQLERLRRSTAFYRIRRNQWAYYDRWYYPVIRELAVHASWDGNFEKLGALVSPPITAEQARQAVETLQQAGLLVEADQGGLRQSSEAVTAEKVPSAVTRRSRKELLLRAIEAMERLDVEKRHIAGVTVALSERLYRQAVEQLDTLRKEILQAALEERDVDKVYQFNFQAFPLSRSIKSEKGSSGAGGAR